ncbi:hypothetical protein MRX96_006043 [Rhipicephalus microplus]
MAKRFLYLVQGLLLCVPNVSPGSTTATTGYSPHSHHFPFCKSQPPHVEPCDVIPKLLPPGSACFWDMALHVCTKETISPMPIATTSLVELAVVLPANRASAASPSAERLAKHLE